MSWIEDTLALPEPRVIVAVGVPGSGKTSLLQPFAIGAGYEYVNYDKIREEVTGDESDMSQDEQVVGLALSRTERALRRGGSVAFDATNTNWERRQILIAQLRNWGAKAVVALWVDVSFRDALQRVNQRGRIVPDYSKFMRDIARMHLRLIRHPPTTGEGFDRVFVL